MNNKSIREEARNKITRRKQIKNAVEILVGVASCIGGYLTLGIGIDFIPSSKFQVSRSSPCVKIWGKARKESGSWKPCILNINFDKETGWDWDSKIKI